jgi:hypothetical protein
MEEAYKKVYPSSVKQHINCKSAIESSIQRNFDGMHLQTGIEDEIIKDYGLQTVKEVLAATMGVKYDDGRFSSYNREWAKTIPLSDSEEEQKRYVINSHPAVLNGFIDFVRKYEEKQKEGEEMAEKSTRHWVMVNVSDDARIGKFEKHSFMMMPTSSAYKGYTYNVYNDRIENGTLINDTQSDSRELSLRIRFYENELVTLRDSAGTETEIPIEEFKAIVDGTTEKDYIRESKKGNDWSSVIIPRAAMLGMYAKSALFALPSSRMSDCSFYVPNKFVDENKEDEQGNVRLRVPKDFEFTITNKATGEQTKIMVEEMKELYTDTTESDFSRQSYYSTSDRNETAAKDGRKQGLLDKHAKIAEYEKVTLFRMPKGEYGEYCFYIPNEFLTEKADEGAYLVDLPEDFIVHLKNNRAEYESEKEKAIKADEFIERVHGKGEEAYASALNGNGHKNIAFAKVEEQLIKNVPDEMKGRKNWVVVRTKVDDTDGKVKKFLIDCHTGKFAKADDPQTWSSFDEARKYAKENGGTSIAYALDGKDDICCIDVDHCIDENGAVTESGKKILEYKDKTYCEKSISGKGLHLFGKTNGYDVRVWSRDGDMEFYQETHFITMTGDGVETKEIMDIDASPVMEIIDEKFTPRLHTTTQGQGIEGLSRMSDRDVIERASKSKTGQTFSELYAGKDLQNNHSNSDMKFMNMLAFWCNGDKDQMDRIFRSSGLYRPEKSDGYVECTIMKAIRDVGGRYQAQVNPSTSSVKKTAKISDGNSK